MSNAIVRNDCLDIMKGILIVLVVAGHSGFPFSHWIYLFHMAVFFMISGYCWNEKHSENINEVIKYIIGRIKRLYVPYALYNGVLIILTNSLIWMNIYTDRSEFLKLGGNGASYGLVEHMNAAETISMLMKCLMFQASGSSQLGGTTWFLRVLFIISVGHCVLIWSLKKIRAQRFENFILLAFALICSVGAELVDAHKLDFKVVNLLFSSYIVYLMGIALNKIERADLFYGKYNFVIFKGGGYVDKCIYISLYFKSFRNCLNGKRDYY